MEAEVVRDVVEGLARGMIAGVMAQEVTAAGCVLLDDGDLATAYLSFLFSRSLPFLFTNFFLNAAGV